MKHFFKTHFAIIFFFCVSTTNSIWETSRKEYIIILDPAGDAKKTGRQIGDSFERGLTLQYVEKIKTILERIPYVKVIISRLPGDTVYELQNASLANRLQADLFINFNFYYTAETKPTLFLYQFSYGTDFATQYNELAFNTYEQAYKIHKTTTDACIRICKNHLEQQQYHSLFSVCGPHALPIKPLIGIITPSICIEAGLKNKEAWQQLVEPLAGAIVEIVEYMNGN